MTLTKENIKVGLKVVAINNPEWGTKTITEDRNGYNVKGRSGESVLSECEYRFWKIVNN